MNNDFYFLNRSLSTGLEITINVWKYEKVDDGR